MYIRDCAKCFLGVDGRVQYQERPEDNISGVKSNATQDPRLHDSVGLLWMMHSGKIANSYLAGSSRLGKNVSAVLG